MIDWSQSKDPRSTQQLIQDGMQVMKETVVIPNEWLPQEWHDNTRGGRTIARLEKMSDERDGITQHQKDKKEKARRIEIYRKQYEQDDRPDQLAGLDYVDVDDYRLYNNQMAFAKYCPAISMENEDE